MAARIDETLEAAAAALAHRDYEAAVALCTEVLRKQPRNQPALRMLGSAQLARGDGAGAVASWTRALKGGLDRELVEYLGVAYLAAGDPDRAVTELRRAIKLGACSAHAHAQLAAALAAQGRFTAAEEVCREALARLPGHARLLMQLAAVLAAHGELDAATAAYAAVPADDPIAADARFNIGVLHERQGRWLDAQVAYEAVLADAPDYVDAHNNLGVLHERAGRLAAARAAYEAVLERAPAHVAALANLGKVLRELGETGLAETYCRRALAVRPDYAPALTNLGNLLVLRDEPAAALTTLRQALTQDPADHQAALTAGMLQLSFGEFSEGWDGYRERPTRRAAVAAGVPLAATLPDAGSRVLLLAEQGLGDELFFLRFAPALRERGLRLYYQCDPRLAGMLERSGEFESIIPTGCPLPESDAVMLVGDTPRLLGTASCSPPLRLCPIPAHVERLQRVLEAFGPPPYIGLTWRAGTPRAAQQADTPVLFKDVPLSRFAGLMRTIPARYVVVQRAPAAGEVDALREQSGRSVLDLSDVNDDLEAMLALMTLLHDYIAVSNTNVHLRAAVDCTAHVLVPHPPEWRWLRTGGHSPWFQGMRVYRQSAQGDWDDAFGALTRDLPGTLHEHAE